MDFNIIFDYPLWFLLLCLLTGFLYSGLLYYRNNKDGFGKILKTTLAVFRFLTVSIIAFLLLAPLVEKRMYEVEDPMLIFLQDNSASINMVHDSSYYRTDYQEEIRLFLDQMSDNFDTRLYGFGEEFIQLDTLDFTGRATNMSQVFREIDARYSNRNIGAVIIAGDGIYNRGVNPVFSASRVSYPIYTLALGDTMPRRDVILRDVNHNRITYLGNRFPVEITVEAFESKDLNSRLIIAHEGTELFSEMIAFSSNHHIETISLYLDAEQAGMQQYEATLSPLPDEVSLQNNSRSFFIDVIDGRQQVLILANSPHPDIGAIKQSLEDNDHYEVDAFLINDFNGNLEAYDLIILHQLPSQQNRARKVFDHVSENQTAILFILGSQTDLNAFNDLQQLLSLQPRSQELTEVLPEYNRAFVHFSLQETVVNLFPLLPPLYSPFARYQATADASIMLYQKVGQVVTDQPLVLFSGDGQTGIISGEGIWRWRLNAFLRHGNHAPIDELLSRIVQYLSIQEDRSRFRVRSEQLVYENDPVLFEAELYNRSFELVNDPEVQLFITNEEGVELPYIMSRTSNAYRLDAGTFLPGSYQWEARVTLGGEVFEESGIFTVSPLDIENLQTIANHTLLYQLADQSGGVMFYPGLWQEMQMHLNNRDDIRQRLYAHREYVEIVNMKLLFFIILFFLTIEWFVRKRSGGY